MVLSRAVSILSGTYMYHRAGDGGGRGISHFSHFQQTFFLFMNRKLNFWELPLPPLLFGSMKEIEVKIWSLSEIEA